MKRFVPFQEHSRRQRPQQMKSPRDGGGSCSAVAPVALAGLLLPFFAGGTSPAWASDARRHGLAGNLGFEDDSDVHAFPQLVARHGNRFGLELAEEGQLLRGGAIFGEAAALGLFVHRPVTGDWFEPFDDGQALLQAFSHFSSLAPPPGTTLESPTPLLELALGFRSGFGLGLKLANSMDQAVIQLQEVQEPPEGEEGGEPKTLTKDVEEGAQSTSLVLNAGWSAYRSNLSFDLAGSLAFHKFKTVVQGKIRGESSLSPSFHLLGRGVLRRTTSTSWLLLAQIYRRNYAVELPFFDNVADQRLLGVRGAFGQRVVLADTVTIAVLAWLGYDTLGYALAKAVGDGSALTGKPGKLTRESTLSTYTLPGLDVALEVQATDWLALRGGWSARYLMYGTESTEEGRVDDPLGIGVPGKTTSRTELRHGWGAGMTAQLGKVRLDGSVTPALLNDGPEMIGGRSPGTFAWVGLSYSWGTGQMPAGNEEEETDSRPRRGRMESGPPPSGYGDPGYPPPAYPPPGAPYYPQGGY